MTYMNIIEKIMYINQYIGMGAWQRLEKMRKEGKEGRKELPKKRKA